MICKDFSAIPYIGEILVFDFPTNTAPLFLWTLNPSFQSECISAQHYHGRVILKRPGSTCMDHKGYCNSFGICVTADSDDKLRDAFERLFSKESMEGFWKWIKTHWYVFNFTCINWWWAKLLNFREQFISHPSIAPFNLTRKSRHVS